MTKRIFITGGAGFIGSAVIKKLLAQQHELFVYDNLSFGKRELADVPDTNFMQADILDHDRLTKCMKDFKPDYVVHLAAIHFIPYCNQHPFASANVNITGTMNVLEACKQQPGLEKAFFASTAAVYPIVDSATSESVKPQPTDIYGLSKLTGESLCHKFFLETGIPTIVCRFFNAFGPNETNPHLIPAIEQQVKSGLRTILLGNLEPKRDFIHTYDMADAVSLLLQKFEKGIDTFNLGRGIEYSVAEVVEAFAAALGEPINISVDESRVRKSDRLHLLADISRLTGFLGWQPKISLQEGIKTLLQETLLPG